MATYEGGAGETRPPAQRPTNRMEGMAQASARVPFRLKVAIVWLVIFLFLGFLFNAADFDTQFMRDRADYVFKASCTPSRSRSSRSSWRSSWR